MNASQCARCGNDTNVIETRRSGDAVKRRRECVTCRERYSTYEERGEWAVVCERCRSCGERIAVVATAAALAAGVVEWYEDARCSACKTRDGA